MSNKVLVVDDDPMIQRLLKKILLSNQLTCDLAGSGPEALKLTTVNRYALILLDITMDGMDGFEVIEELRARGIDTPIIVVAARARTSISSTDWNWAPMIISPSPSTRWFSVPRSKH